MISLPRLPLPSDLVPCPSISHQSSVIGIGLPCRNIRKLQVMVLCSGRWSQVAGRRSQVVGRTRSSHRRDSILSCPQCHRRPQPPHLVVRRLLETSSAGTLGHVFSAVFPTPLPVPLPLPSTSTSSPHPFVATTLTVHPSRSGSLVPAVCGRQSSLTTDLTQHFAYRGESAANRNESKRLDST